MKKRFLLLLLSGSHFFLINAYPDFIKSCTIVNKNKIVVKANEKFSQQFIKQDFFARYDESIDLTQLDETVVQIPFIMSIVPVVWISNKTYSIDVMDEDLYHSLQKIKKIFKLFYPKYKWVGKLVPKKLVKNDILQSRAVDKPAVATLFSGGLDSVSTVMSCNDTKQLLITMWGADVKLKNKREWDAVLAQCRRFAQTYGHEHTVIKSNFREFIETLYLRNKFPTWWRRASHALALTGLTAPMLAQYNMPTLLIASTHTAVHPYPLGSHPAIDNNINIAGITIHHYGSDKSRVQKIVDIGTICKKNDLPLPYLRVCCKDPHGGNCLKCSDKCLCTAISVAVAGYAPQEYGFNISVSEAVKRAFLFFKKAKYLRRAIRMLCWECNTPYLDSLPKRARMNRTLSDQDVDILQNFFDSIDFSLIPPAPAGLFFNNVSYSQERQKLFNDLWKKHSKPCPIKGKL